MWLHQQEVIIQFYFEYVMHVYDNFIYCIYMLLKHMSNYMNYDNNLFVPIFIKLYLLLHLVEFVSS